MPKLIPDWRKAWTYLSIHAAVLLGLLATAYDYLPAMRAYMPDGWVKWAALVIIAARLIQQGVPQGDFLRGKKS